MSSRTGASTNGESCHESISRVRGTVASFEGAQSCWKIGRERYACHVHIGTPNRNREGLVNVRTSQKCGIYDLAADRVELCHECVIWSAVVRNLNRVRRCRKVGRSSEPRNPSASNAIYGDPTGFIVL